MTAYDRLTVIIPQDQALANKALAVSLLQITGISRTQLPSFANTVSNTTTTYGLDQLNSQTSPVPASTVTYYQNLLGGGTGPNGTIVLTDILGAAGGITYTQYFVDTVTAFASMDLSVLTEIYNTMVDTINGVYGTGPVVIPSGPAAGTYTTIDDALATGLIPAANAEIVTLTTTYPTETATLTTNWTSMAQQLATEISTQAKAGIVWADLIANSQPAILGFILGLASFGKNTEKGGPAELLEAIADVTTYTGQTIIGMIRQSQNQAALSASNLGGKSTISSDPNPPPAQATLSPTQPPYPG